MVGMVLATTVLMCWPLRHRRNDWSMLSHGSGFQHSVAAVGLWEIREPEAVCMNQDYEAHVMTNIDNGFTFRRKKDHSIAWIE